MPFTEVCATYSLVSLPNPAQSFVTLCDGYEVEGPRLKRVGDKDAHNLYSTFSVGYIDKCATIYGRYFSGKGRSESFM